MGAVQFFLFGLFFAWFTGSGKLKAVMNALMQAPPEPSTTTPLPVGTPTVTGIGALPSMPTGDIFDPNNPRNIWNGDPFGLNGTP